MEEPIARAIVVILYSGILVYLGYIMGRRKNTQVIADTIESLMRTGFVKWYWKDNQREIVKWSEQTPKEKNV
jgi:hypothetical protein|tara:strand:- start:507 stop:722 length:216 start_codon:yes stop_codon:yes gene_type:complete